MKKIIALILVMSCFVLTLAGCGSKDSASENDNVLRVGMECAYAPYNWTQSDDSNGAVPIADSSDYAYGYDVMMAKYLAEEMGMELEIVRLEWAALIPALQSGTIDCVIAGQSITAERLTSVDFTTPYYYASIVALTTNDSPYANATSLADLKGATCTSQLSTVWYDECLPQIEDANILAAQESAPSMLVALDSGAVNLVVTDMPTAMAAVSVYDNMKILDLASSGNDFEVSDEEINIGISVKKGNSELLDKLNAGLAKLTTADFTDWMDEAISVQPLSN